MVTLLQMRDDRLARNSKFLLISASYFAILNDIILNQRGGALTQESDGGPGWLRYACGGSTWPGGAEQGGYIFYAGGSIAGVSCCRRWRRLLLLP